MVARVQRCRHGFHQSIKAPLVQARAASGQRTVQNLHGMHGGISQWLVCKHPWALIQPCMRLISHFESQIYASSDCFTNNIRGETSGSDRFFHASGERSVAGALNCADPSIFVLAWLRAPGHCSVEIFDMKHTPLVSTLACLAGLAAALAAVSPAWAQSRHG